ncbi:oligoribonuclease [Diaporthe helianthi]|uniref:Oligoribonuclease n=1 Tax=Diaporthe helianthi TaxID=158607 RepID=A0A2P5I3C9_DIAHE|nr:oligoribonuclease [Diaporthe helianthi]
MAQQNSAPLVWIDCEMTGLDYNNDEIIEIYCLITNGNLVLADTEGWGTVVHQSTARMAQMDDWCTRTHAQSGLTAAVVTSTVTPEQAADGLLAYIMKHVLEPRTAILAGNSVHMDRAFLNREPYRKVVDYLHYRIFDVSSLKEASRRWLPQVTERAPKKKLLHKAKDDILESIEEARFYKEAIFERKNP